MQSLGEWLKSLLDTYLEYLKFWVSVNHYQEAVVLTAGKYTRTLGPGYHLKCPLLEYAIEVDIKPDTLDVHPVSVSTLDGKSITIGLMINYEIVDTMLFLIETNDALSNLRDIARGEMSDYLEDINWVDIKKKTTKNAITKLIQKKCESMGIKINDLKFTDKIETRMYKLFS